MNIDFSRLQKSLCDTVSINYNQHHFLIALASGESVVAFAMPPELMKAFADGLPDKIKEYESKYGPIDVSGAEGGIQSPIQIT
ncbi:MAG: hypothetical protein ACM3TU_01545 [Bacillota bacterium]